MKTLLTLFIAVQMLLLVAMPQVLVIPAEATPTEKHAAEILQKNLALVNSKTLPIVTDDQFKGDLSPLFIGKCRNLNEYGFNIDFNALGVGGVRIAKNNRALVLGGNKRGIIYATYSLLQDYWGFRWFAPDCKKIPATLAELPETIDYTYTPPFEYRDTDNRILWGKDATEFTVANKLNGAHVPTAGVENGGYITYSGFVHTFSKLVPLKEFAVTHPEYYSEINGKRVTTLPTQLCMTNPEVVQIVIDRTLELLRKNPDNIVSISQNDGNFSCQCVNCLAVAKKEGAYSGVLIHFLNQVAEAVCKEFPNCQLDTLAYDFTLIPPRHVKPHPNIIIRLCPIGECFGHPLDNCEENKNFINYFKGWAAISNRLHIWEYIINFANCFQPFPNLHVMRENARFYRSNHVVGVYESGSYFTTTGELTELRSYVLAQVLWNPDVSVDTLIKEFTEAYYGAAGPAMQKYIGLLENHLNDGKTHMAINTSAFVYLNDPKLIAASFAALDEARKAVAGSDPVIQKRVEYARLPMLYTRIQLKLDSPEARQKLLDEFERIATDNKVGYIAEGRKLPEWLAIKRSNTDYVEPALGITYLGSKNLAPVIDGVIDETIWQRSPDYHLTHTDGSMLNNPAQVRLLSDDDYLYIAVKVPDDNIICNQREHDSPVWTDDSIEIQVGNRTKNLYYRIIVNAAGVIYDDIIYGPQSWTNPADVKTSRGDKVWYVEARWPLAKVRSAPGDELTFNICRGDWPGPHYSNLITTFRFFRNFEHQAKLYLRQKP